MLPLDHFHSKQSVDHLYNTFGICDTVFKAQFTVNDLGISYRTANYWDTNSLFLSIRKKEKGWRRFSFIEYFWLSIVQYLRAFGFSLDTIQHIKAMCTRPVPEDILRSVRRKESLVQPRDRKPNFLTNIVAELVSCQNHISLVYTEQGQLYVLHLNTVLGNETRAALISPFLNYVSISLSAIYVRFLLETDDETIAALDIFPASIVAIVKELHAGTVKELIINYPHNQVNISREYYQGPDDFARDCIRLLTTTVYLGYEAIHEAVCELQTEGVPQTCSK